MPLINGQKMACEPCIRGHRSTKCTHANERLMVPVRKPGRPLSSCPHPSSRACSCAAVTAAIPRKQKCRCGTSQPVPAESSSDRDVSSGALTPPSPSKTANAAFRVQKQGSKSAPSRKQSVDPAGLERMDSSQLNILPAFNGMQQAVPVSSGHTTPMSDMPMYGAMGSPFSPEPAMFPMFQYPMQSQLMTPAPSEPVTNGGGGGPSTSGSTTAAAAPTPGGCCGGGASRARSQMSRHTRAVNGATEMEAKECCSTAADPREPEPRTKPLSALELTQQPNGVMVPPFQPPMTVHNGVYTPYYSQPTIFSYPPQFGSFLQPLQPEQWRQFMATVNFGQPAAPSPQPAAPSAFDMPRPPPINPSGTPNGAPWTSHQCSCGDSCQCVGCAAHPYNEATQDYVRSAWSTVMEDGQKMRAHSQDHSNVINGNINGDHERSASGASNGGTTPVKSQAEGTLSPVAPQTPSDGTSGLGEEQTLSANDFFFVSYPFGESCAGETASCPCGDDCQCIGCVIHNNPGSEHAVEDPLCL